MGKDPAFLFYSSDFITGTQVMTFEDRGKYISILCQMHQQGRLDEETIRFLVGSVSDKLRLKFKVDENGLWYNQRLELETEKRNKFTESRRLNGSEGGRPKKNKPIAKPKGNLNKTDRLAKQNLMEDVNENINAIEKVNKNESGIHQKFIDCYFDFYKSKFDVNPKLEIQDFKALKDIRIYLEKESTDKSEDGALRSWEFILKNFGKLSTYLQSKLKPSQINQELVNILPQLKNGAPKTGNSNDYKASELDNLRRKSEQILRDFSTKNIQ